MTIYENHITEPKYCKERSDTMENGTTLKMKAKGFPVVLCGNWADILDPKDHTNVLKAFQGSSAQGVMDAINTWIVVRGNQYKKRYRVDRYGATYGVFEDTGDLAKDRLLCCYIRQYGISEGPGLGAETDELINAIPFDVLGRMISKSMDILRKQATGGK